MVLQRREQAVCWPRSKALGEPAAQLLPWDGKWLVPSAVRRSLGKPGSFSHPPTALTLPAAQLWMPKKGKQKKYVDFMVSSLPLFSGTRPAVSLISDLNCIDCTIEAKATTVIIHFWIRSPSQEKIFCKHNCPACTGWNCWHPLILSIFYTHNYRS